MATMQVRVVMDDVPQETIDIFVDLINLLMALKGIHPAVFVEEVPDEEVSDAS